MVPPRTPAEHDKRLRAELAAELGWYPADLDDARLAYPCRGVTQSMGRTGSALDNAVSEAFDSTLEWELLRGNHFATREQARHSVATWIDEYNNDRKHSTNGMLSPVDYELVCATRPAEADVGEGGRGRDAGLGAHQGPARRGSPGPATGRRSARAAIRPARPRGTGEQWPPAMRRRGGSSTHRQSWSPASVGSVEEPQFEFHRLVIQNGQAVGITLRLRCPWGGSDHCPSQAPPCRILWETWLIGHSGIAHPRTILEGAQIWNHSRLGPSIEGV